MDDVIERLEALSGPCRDIDAEIHHWHLNGVGTGYRQDAPAYNATLDPALTLMPEGGQFSLDSHYSMVTVYITPFIDGLGPTPVRFAAEASCRSLPIALCIAALKARKAA